MNDDPFAPYVTRSGGAQGKAFERVELGRMDNGNGIRTRSTINPDGSETVVKSGAGLVRFIHNAAPEEVADFPFWPLTERNYAERVYFSRTRAHLSESTSPTMPHKAISHFLMLDKNGEEVSFELVELPT